MRALTDLERRMLAALKQARGFVEVQKRDHGFGDVTLGFINSAIKEAEELERQRGPVPVSRLC